MSKTFKIPLFEKKKKKPEEKILDFKNKKF